jgi:hypothetical protein
MQTAMMQVSFETVETDLPPALKLHRSTVNLLRLDRLP